MNKRSVDIIIPTYKPDGRLSELLKRLGRQNHPIRHIYVINTRSEHFPQEVREMAGVIVEEIDAVQFDHGGTRDYGMHLSDAEMVIFMTQDAVPADSRLIEALLRPFADEKVAVSYARQLANRDCDVMERYTRTFNYPEESRVKSINDIEELGIKTFFCSNVCAAYRRTAYDALGGFTKKTIFNEDMILAGQAIFGGYKIAYCGDANVYHSHNYSGLQQFHRNFDLAVSQAEHSEVFAKVQSEGEGIKLVKNTFKYFIQIKKFQWIPVLIYKSGCKYLGYKLGHIYERLPLWLIKLCTMNKMYWK